MKLFKAFTSGKNILLYDQPKLVKYLNLCSNTPITYQGIKNCLGYKDIISIQFNYIKFNTGLYSQFNKLIFRDLNLLDQQEFNSYLQTIKNYITYTQIERSFDIKQIQEIIQNISNQGTFIQKGNFYIHYVEYFSLGNNLDQLKNQIDNFLESLLDYKPQTFEEEIWKYFIQKSQIDYIEKIGKRKLQEKDYEFLEQFITNIEVLLVKLNSFENLSTKLEILRLNTILKKANKELNQKKYQSMIIILKQCQAEIDMQISCLNTFQLSSYIFMVGRNQNLLMNMSWDLIRNEIVQRNLDEMPLQDMLALLIFFYQQNQINDQFANCVIRHLYQNINLINAPYLAKCFEISAAVNSKFSEKFISKLEQKVNPKILSIDDISNILIVLVDQGSLKQLTLEKYLQGLTNRLVSINQVNSYGILYALNNFKLQNKEIMNRIFQLQFQDDQEIKSQIQILQYLQLHDPKNPRVQKIQKNLVIAIEKKNENELLNQLISILVNVNEQTQKTIKIIPELKPHIKQYINQIDWEQEFKELPSEIKGFLEQQYDIK